MFVYSRFPESKKQKAIFSLTCHCHTSVGYKRCLFVERIALGVYIRHLVRLNFFCVLVAKATELSFGCRRRLGAMRRLSTTRPLAAGRSLAGGV